jgi:hypothetical protein
LVLILSGFNLTAEVSIYFSNDIVNRFNATLKQYQFENDTLFEADLGLLDGFILSAENFIGYEDEIFFDEIKAGLEVWFFPFISLGVRHIFFFSDGFSPALSICAKLAYDNECIGLSITDENDFIINYLDSNFEYVNSLGAEKMFKLNDTLILSAELSNDFAWNEEESFSDSISAGPGIWIKYFGISVKYSLLIVPEIEHSIEGHVIFEYPARTME